MAILKDDMRIVLVGKTGAGKSSSLNTILGLGSPLTNHRKAAGEVAGRQVTVVDTPGWPGDTPVQRTPELVRKEIEYSVLQCVPGPHAFLLAVNVSAPFRKQDKTSVVGHMELIGERVFSHAMLLFTHGDLLGDASIEEHIEREGEALRWFLEKCGNRYHVISNVNNKGDGSQVTELLEKIEKMVAENGDEPFYPVKVEVLVVEGDAEVEEDAEVVEEDWEYVWEGTRSMPIKRGKSLELPPPSFGGEDRSSGRWSWKTSVRKESDTISTQTSAYGSLLSLLSGSIYESPGSNLYKRKSVGHLNESRAKMGCLGCAY